MIIIIIETIIKLISIFNKIFILTISFIIILISTVIIIIIIILILIILTVSVKFQKILGFRFQFCPSFRVCQINPERPKATGAGEEKREVEEAICFVILAVCVVWGWAVGRVDGWGGGCVSGKAGGGGFDV